MNRCPFCNHRRITPLGDCLFRCADCDKLFDNDPDEGGTYSDRHADARIIRQEVAQERRAAALARRHDRYARRIGR
jgi:ribosomal protein L37AE/L43A